MLKLKYLFHNESLAKMLLGHWEYDEESLDLFKYYRISSNAVYPFRFQGRTQLLRFAPAPEKRQENVLAELEFIAYLRSRGYGALETVEATDGVKLVEAQTPWGSYYASVFRRVPGAQLSQIELRSDIIHRYGAALGELHRLSSTYEPAAAGCKRWSWQEALAWMQEELAAFPMESAALAEAELLQDCLSRMPASSADYGLIHYDFECDNVFYDEQTQMCHVIDFDDALYHWYVMDIEQALGSLQDELPAEQMEQARRAFLDGYATTYDLPEENMVLVAACRRFAGLYSYVRCLRALSEQWNHEPEWMTGLRAHLQQRMKGIADIFGSEIR